MEELENRNTGGDAGALSGDTPRTSFGDRRDLEHAAREHADDAKEQIRSLAETGKERVVARLDHVARALRGAGDSLRDEDEEDLSTYATEIGDRVERVSRYLREHDSGDLVAGVERMARERPLLFLGGAFACGVALGRFLKSRPPEGGARGRIESGYAMGGYDVERGYPEPEESVVTAPTTSVGSPSSGGTPQGFAPAGTFAPSGTFGGGGDGRSS